MQCTELNSPPPSQAICMETQSMSSLTLSCMIYLKHCIKKKSLIALICIIFGICL